MHPRNRIKRFSTVIITFCALTLFSVLTAAALSYSGSAQAAPRWTISPRPQVLGVLAPSAIYTDAYEPNDSQYQAASLGVYNQLPCPPVILLNNATFYKTGSPDPATDQDFYRVQLGALLNYTFTLMQQVPSDLRFNALLYDPAGNMITYSMGLTNPIMSTYSGNGGTFTLQLAASNNITSTEDKPYQVTMCSSTLSPTPTNTPQGIGPDAYEPNDTIAESVIATGTRSTPSFIAVDSRIDNLNFYPAPEHVATGDVADWFEFYARGGSIYQITTLNVQPGVETVMAIYKPVADPNNPALSLVSAIGGSSNPNNRYQVGQRGSQVKFQTPNGGDGMYWINITNIDLSPRIEGQTYSLQVQEILQTGPTATPNIQPRLYLPIIVK